MLLQNLTSCLTEAAHLQLNAAPVNKKQGALSQ